MYDVEEISIYIKTGNVVFYVISAVSIEEFVPKWLRKYTCMRIAIL